MDKIKKYLPHIGSFSAGFVAGAAFTGCTQIGAKAVAKVKGLFTIAK